MYCVLCIYLTRDTVRCARLAAGGLLQCVDSVLTDQAAAGWAVVRPPGSASKRFIRRFVITEKAFTFKTILRHYVL